MRNASLVLVLFALTGCDDGGGTGGSGGASSTTSASSTSSGKGTTSSGAGTTGASMATTGAGNTTASTGAGADPFEAQRQACIDKINALRATKSLAPYARWKSAEACVDQQATHDETNNSPHGAWSGQLYPSCNGNAQNECLGQGPNGIEACLDQMWAEKDQAGCAGCDACADAYNPNCPNCDFFGSATGDVCGHYVNMSAKYFTEAACGFSSLGGWDAINFH